MPHTHVADVIGRQSQSSCGGVTVAVETDRAEAAAVAATTRTARRAAGRAAAHLQPAAAAAAAAAAVPGEGIDTNPVLTSSNHRAAADASLR